MSILRKKKRPPKRVLALPDLEQSKTTVLMSERPSQHFQSPFNVSLKVDFHGSRVACNGSLFLVRELDGRLDAATLITEHLSNSPGRAWRQST